MRCSDFACTQLLGLSNDLASLKISRVPRPTIHPLQRKVSNTLVRRSSAGIACAQCNVGTQHADTTPLRPGVCQPPRRGLAGLQMRHVLRQARQVVSGDALVALTRWLRDLPCRPYFHTVLQVLWVCNGDFEMRS